MSVKASGGSPVAQPQRYQTVPIAVISHAEQQNRDLKSTELQELADFFSSGNKLLEIAATLTQNSDQIVLAGANRIFVGGSPMAYLEKPKEQVGLPGSGYYVGEDYLSAARRHGQSFKGEPLKVQIPTFGSPLRILWERVRGMLNDQDPLPGGFRFINVSRYGPVRMKRSMRDLSWFLRYITYAIVAGDSSILSVNVRGLRGVIPEDVTEATVVALREMRRQSLSYFKEDGEATELVKRYFDGLISEYLADKPSAKLRIGVSNNQQGLQLPQSYFMAAEVRPKFVMKQGATVTQKQEAIKAAYRQVFERDVTETYGFPKTELESQVSSGNISMKEFVRCLGKSRLYRRLFYEPFTLSRVVELAMRHFLGRGLSCREEFQEYFAVITKGGLPALVDALIDSPEYADYFGEETVPYLRGLGQEAQECCNWGPQLDLFKFSAPVRKVPQFITLFGRYKEPLPDQHPYGSGNDPLEIQFGAIFPQETRNPHAQPAFFSKDTRRILISCGSGSPDQLSNGAALGKVPGSLGSRVLKLEPVVHFNSKQPNGAVFSHQRQQGPSVSLSHHSPSALLEGAYRQVFGRPLYEGQRLFSAESELQGGNITVREFVRQLAKSKVFRSLYWETTYITKAIEYIHRRLLGRPTYGRQEMNRYYDICSTKGFYALIDAIIDSPEYAACFGEDTVPYERYVTPRGYLMRSPHQASPMQDSQQDAENPENFNTNQPSREAVLKYLEQPIINSTLDGYKPDQEAELTDVQPPVSSCTPEESNEYSQASNSER
jgi:phycobilisome core-membrane linker protein